MKDKDKSSQKKKAVSSGGSAQQTSPAQIEARFQAVFESSRTAIGVSKAGTHVFVNPAYLDLFGFPPGTDLAGKPVLELIAPEKRDQINAYILRRVQGESAPSIYETRGLRTDGSVFDMEVTESSHRDNGEDYALMSLRDISRRKMAEEEIAERGAMLRQIMDTASVAIFLLDKSGRITHANSRMAEMFGCTLKELVGCEYVELVHPSEKETGRKNMLALLASEIPSVDLERLYWRKDGTEFWGHLACRRFQDVQGNELGLIGVISDISLHRQAEEELKESEQKYKLLIEATNTGYVIIDEKGRVLDANREYVRITGRGRLEDILGLPVTDWTASYDLARNAAEIGKCMETGSVSNLLIDYVDAKGKTTPIEINATVLRGPSIVRIFTVCRDITERKRSEVALKQSEANYRRLYNETPVLLHSINRDARLVDVNDYWLKTMGYERNEVIGRKVTDFYTDASRTYAREIVQPAFFRDGSVKDISFQFIKKNGEVLDVLLSATAERDASGNFVRSLAVIEDTTERKRAEEALKRSERMLQTIIDTEPDCIKVIDEESRLIMMNRAGLNMIQADSLDEVKGQFVCPLVAPEYQQAFMDLTDRVFKGGSGSMEFRMVGMRGSQLWLETHAVPLRNEKNEIIALLGVTREITERKRTEEVLRENQSRLDLALQSAHMGVWRWEIKEDRRYFDDLTCQILGIEATTFHGNVEDFYRAVHPDDREKVKAALARALELDVPYEPSYRVVWPDGSVHYITSRGRLFRDDKRQPTRFNGILWDITDQRRVEQELIETEKLESIGTLAGGIAHDFNNLLQGVFGFISMAKLTFDQKEKSLAMLAQAEKALHQSVNLTSQLLTFSKGGKPVKKVFALRPLIENSVAFALSGSRVTYEIDIADNLRAVEADEGQIGQVIQNIVLNADQAMPLGGMIRVSVRNAIAAAIDPPAGLQGDLVEITIRDQGTGIPAGHLVRIFDPYFTTKEKGSGLGLATSYSIIKNHGGLIRVQSEAGKGTDFFIYLPASGAKGEETNRSATPAAMRKCRILVMDDEEIIRAVAGEMLIAIGHEVAFAETGETALEAYRAARTAGSPFDAVILDLTIRGGMGGMDALRELKQIDPGVKAVVSSGYSDDTAFSNYREQGFLAFLKKPYKIEELQRTLNALLA